MAKLLRMNRFFLFMECRNAKVEGDLPPLPLNPSSLPLHLLFHPFILYSPILYALPTLYPGHRSVKDEGNDRRQDCRKRNQGRENADLKGSRNDTMFLINGRNSDIQYLILSQKYRNKFKLKFNSVKFSPKKSDKLLFDQYFLDASSHLYKKV